MKLKHFTSIFSFLAAFGLSVLFVGLPVYKIRSSQAPCGKKPPVAVSSETELQDRLRKFLEADRQTGIELANDKVLLSQFNNQWNTEKLATLTLVEKMQKVKCDGLPEDFCVAWDEHFTAWKLMANFLFSRDFKRQKTLAGFEREDYAQLNRRINNTYENMLAAARKHGVDFKF